MKDTQRGVSGATVLVTAVVSGIGSAARFLLISSAARVIAVERDEERCQRAVAAIHARGEEADACVLNLTSMQEVESAAEKIWVNCGLPHIPISPPGGGLIRPLAEIDGLVLELLVRMNAIDPIRPMRASPPRILGSEPARWYPPFPASLLAKIRDGLIRRIPFLRRARPEEAAKVIAFLASQRSNFVTRQPLSVSGGLAMAD